jgi:hypothetical protein
MPGTEVEIKRGGRGDFIVTAGETVVWDKRNMGGQFPDEDEVVDELRALG